uniref:Uncharacterized protein n=1 Tax=Anopheles culicifacies TaxID=139723 RepID=A0A182LVN3_9DIPT
MKACRQSLHFFPILRKHRTYITESKGPSDFLLAGAAMSAALVLGGCGVVGIGGTNVPRYSSLDSGGATVLVVLVVDDAAVGLAGGAAVLAVCCSLKNIDNEGGISSFFTFKDT